MYGHAYLRSLEKTYAEVEMRKGDTGHTAVVCALGRVTNRLAQTQEILPKITRAFISVSCQPLLKESGESPSWPQRLPFPAALRPRGNQQRWSDRGQTVTLRSAQHRQQNAEPRTALLLQEQRRLYTALSLFYLAFSFLSFLIKRLHLISFPISNNREGWSESALCSSTTSMNTDFTLPKNKRPQAFSLHWIRPTKHWQRESN